LVDTKTIKTLPIKDHVAAISAGVVNNQVVLDLDYEEDSAAETDANFVIAGKGGIVEIQSTAEAKPFELEQFQSMFDFAQTGIQELIKLQMQVLYPTLSQ
jgi:ribonuclease PH